MADVNGLEKQLDDVFGKQAPKMPDGGKKFFVQWLPILTLVGAIFSTLSAWWLWDAAHTVNKLANWANELSKAYGGDRVSTSQLTFWVWAGMAFLALNAVMYFMAYQPLKNHQKRGWDLLFYVSLLSVAYSVVSIFIDGRGFGSLISGLIGAAIGWWILFQIRPAYTEKPVAPKTNT